MLLQKFDINLAISSPRYISNYLSIPLRIRDSGVVLYSQKQSSGVGHKLVDHSIDPHVDRR